MKSKELAESGVKQDFKVASMPKMTRKNDFVVWMFLSDIQMRIYRDFLQLDNVKELLLKTSKRSPLVELTILKKICDSPRLLTQR